MTENKIFKLATFFRVFGDESRLKILFLLKDNSYRVTDIAAKLNMSQSAVSHQLQVLRLLDLVKMNRQRKEIFYMLGDHHINTILEDGVEHITEVNDE